MDQEWGRRRSDNQPYPKTRGKENLPRGLKQVAPKRKIYVTIDARDAEDLRKKVAEQYPSYELEHVHELRRVFTYSVTLRLRD